jgi:putative tricarboxylic transport membrane protein
MVLATNQQNETALGVVLVFFGVALAVGAVDIPSDAGYGGVGPNFLPWVVAIVLMICGALMVWQARTTGFLMREEPEGAASGNWMAFAWVSAGILANALLINSLGFVLSCTLCFVLAVRGFHLSQGRLDLSPKAWLRDTLIGLAIAAPVYWMFGKLLAIQLPGLSSTGWI